MTLVQCLNKAREKLDNAAVPDSSYDAFLLLEYVTGISRTQYLSRQNDNIEAEKLSQYEKLVQRRASREPLQHIIGSACFFGYDYKVSGDVLIPRQETELLVERVLEAAKGYPSGRLLDMCTGSGCIAVTLYLELTKDNVKCDITASDISDRALNIARENAKSLTGRSDNIHFIQSDMFDNIDGSERYDIIVSNPPYIPAADIEGLEPEVKYDPQIALDGGSDGLLFYRRLADEASDYLNDGGCIYMETGFDQGDDIAAIMRNRGYTDIRIFKDLAGHNRIIGGRYVR